MGRRLGPGGYGSPSSRESRSLIPASWVLIWAARRQLYSKILGNQFHYLVHLGRGHIATACFDVIFQHDPAIPANARTTVSGELCNGVTTFDRGIWQHHIRRILQILR